MLPVRSEILKPVKSASFMTSPSARARPACSLCGLDLRRAFRNTSWPRRLHQKSIETAQPLILLFQEFAIGDDLCSWWFWFRSWRNDTVVAIEPLFRCVFYGEATSQLIDLRLGTRVCCENRAENHNCEPCPTIAHAFSRFTLRPSATSRRLALPPTECRARSALSTLSRTLDPYRRGAICKDLRDLRSPCRQWPPFHGRVRGCQSLGWQKRSHRSRARH